MTREENIRSILECNFSGFKDEIIDVAVNAILNLKEEAIKQPDVLDKIRAEIMQVANQEKFHDEKWALGLRYAVKIIDKYRKEEPQHDERRI